MGAQCECTSCRFIRTILEDQAARHGANAYRPAEVLSTIARVAAYFAEDIAKNCPDDGDPINELFVLAKVEIMARNGRDAIVHVAADVRSGQFHS